MDRTKTKNACRLLAFAICLSVFSLAPYAFGSALPAMAATVMTRRTGGIDISQAMPTPSLAGGGNPASAIPASDLALGTAVSAADRTDMLVAIDNLRDLISPLDSGDCPAMLAAIRVHETGERFNDGTFLGEGQIVTAEILPDFFYGDDPGSDTLAIKQYLFGGCQGGIPTNALQDGRVYVVPLCLYEEGYWSVYGDFQCLFEVEAAGETGIVRAHSDWPRLKKYDGKPLRFLLADIAFLLDNPLLRSGFASCILGGFTVEISGPDIFLAKPDFLPTDAYRASIVDGRVAVTTRSRYGVNVFEPLEGMTLEQVTDALRSIKEYEKSLDCGIRTALPQSHGARRAHPA